MVFNSYYNKSFYDWRGLTPPAWGTGLYLLAGFRLPVKTTEKGKELLFRQVVLDLPEEVGSQDLNHDMIGRNG